MTKGLALIGSIFLGIGVLLLGLAAFSIAADSIFEDEGLRADGVVIALARTFSGNGTTYAPVVEWQDNRGAKHTFTSSTSSYPASFARGDSVTVIYDPDRPGKAIIDSFGQRFTGIFIFGGIGIVFALIGGPIVYFYMRRRWMIGWLKKYGTLIEVDFVRCEIDRSSTSNGRNPYRVHAQGKHPRTGKLASFMSEPIWLDLTSELEGKAVPVLINRKKHGPHFIDLSEWVHSEETA
ncbi:DUF3592 domain-containing protein [Erythrobacter crassostreae]|uniref:DUF3592 domain-containing protein n=1 Tax=Erythrobacter crassostreae TaxID=2828328 RepID=A0A9X1F2Y1_9SPHN|nr:DUF3592 domain-containing protein [Erythrobacter crassostrea]MBV7258363.1 DUF3592 domain-containing protein [Erythrobacter crassostrea]